MLIMSATAHLFGLRPAALIGFPVMMIGATTLILLLLYLVGPEEDGVADDPMGIALSSALMPAIAVDPQTGRILQANEQAADLIGSARLTVGNHFSDLFVGDARDACQNIFRTAVERGVAEMEACSVRTLTAEPGVVSVFARHHDIEDDPFILFGFSAGDTNRAVAHFARVQERLMSNISHELRTPLNVVMGFSELLTTGTLGEMPDNQLDAAEECHEGGKRMLRLINDILDVGRSRSYYLAGEVRVFSPAEMITRVENLLSGQARREDLKLQLRVDEGLPAIESEERSFKQIVYHLMLNSMDRSDPGGLIQIAASENTDRELVVTVTDTGPEVTEPIHARAFEASSEEEAHRTLAPPLLGLPLCATLAERLGGSLTTHADSEGVHFVVTLPRSSA